MNFKRFISFLFIFFLTTSSANAVLISTFDVDAEGWGAVGDYTNFKWVDTGGNPNGYIEAKDLSRGSTWYFSPIDWQGDWSTYIGGTLEYDIKLISSNGSYYSNDDIRIFSGSDYAAWRSGINPLLNIWTQYELNLVDSNFTISGSQSFNQIMSNVTDLYIRGEYIVGGDTEGLDNVRVASAVGGSPVPEPATIFLLGFGLVGLAGFRRKFKK